MPSDIRAPRSPRSAFVATLALVAGVALSPTSSAAQDGGTTDERANRPGAGTAPSRAIDPANFDSATSPCQDFYQYANGGWFRHVHLPPVLKLIDADYYEFDLKRQLDRDVRWLLEQARTAPVTADATTRVVGALYASCLYGNTADDTLRSRQCTNDTDSLLGDAVGELYARYFFPPSAAAQAQALVDGLFTALQRRLQAMPWLSAQARDVLLARQAELVADTSFRVQVPASWTDFGPLALSRTNFRANLDSVQAWRGRQPEPPGRRVHWLRGYLAPWQFQPPAFDPTADPASNYGVYGFILGHEIMHLFPKPGLDFVSTAVSFTPDLSTWGSEDSIAFLQRLRPLMDQMNAAGRGAVRYALDGDGMMESYSDLGGMLIAYDAFEQAMQGRPHSPIDGLTPEQRFFVAIARTFRTNAWEGQPNFYDVPHDGREPYWMDGPGRDHPPMRLRINVTMANMPAFARAFGCTVGAPMARPDGQRVEIY